MLRFLPATGLLLGASLWAHDSDAQAARAARMTSVSPAHCVAALERGEDPDPLRCPTALRLAVAEAQRSCADKGGQLTGVAEGDVWAIDVNADSRNELLFSLEGNVTCTEPWNLFACGTMRCPRNLYELRNGRWSVVGNIAADSPEQVRLGAAQAADGHRSLEVCARDRCSEPSIYEWVGSRYEATRVAAR